MPIDRRAFVKKMLARGRVGPHGWTYSLSGLLHDRSYLTSTLVDDLVKDLAPLFDAKDREEERGGTAKS
jgi:hypothetical protein